MSGCASASNSHTDPKQHYPLEGPAWLDAARYDVLAKTSAATPREQLLLMLRTVLADRFQLKMHLETRRLRGYALVVARRGPRLKPASGARANFTFGAGHIVASELSMAEFADRLGGPVFPLNRPVIDSTGLTGAFDFTLEWSAGDSSVETLAKPSLFTAIEEQLGLKLRPTTSVIDVWVVDHAERVPAGN